MFDTLPEHVPAWTASTFDSSIGVDFLGTRAANLAMLRQLTGVYNNQVVSARQHAILAWCAWRFVRAAEAAGRSETSSSDWRQFLEAVETVQLVAQQTAGPQLGGVAGGLGSESRQQMAAESPHIPLRFADYGRTHQTSAMAAVQYGPSARAAGLGFLSVKDGLATVYERGLRLATALDDLLKDAPGLERLVRLPVPESFPRKLAEELGRRGLCIPGPEHPVRPERAPYIDALFGFDGLQTDDHRAQTLTLVLEWARRLGGTDGLTDHEVRRKLLGHDLDADPMPERLQPTALRWRLFQVRQLHRYGMESWLGLVERAMAAGRRDVYQLLDDLDEAIDGSELAEIWRLPAAKAVTRLLPDPAAWTRQHAAGPWVSVWEDIANELKKQEGDEARAARAALRLTLASVALTAAWVPLQGELRNFAGTGGRTRISLLTFASWWAARAGFPLRSVMGELLEELVLQQHVGVAVSRFDGRGRRLRFSLGDRGWELLPGTVPSTPTLTSDRLGACMRLLADLGLLREMGRRGGSAAWRITSAGRAVLARALHGEGTHTPA